MINDTKTLCYYVAELMILDFSKKVKKGRFYPHPLLHTYNTFLSYFGFKAAKIYNDFS